MATIRDVAQHADVSAGTVSNVLNRPSYVNPETRERVERAMHDLGFTPRSASRQFRQGRIRTLGLVVVDLGIPFFVDVALGADAMSRELGASMVVCNSGEDTKQEENCLDVLVQHRVQGVLIAPVDEHNPRLEAMLERGVPVVFVDRTPSIDKCCSVATNDLGGGALAGRHLMNLGHRRLGFVGDPAAHLQMGARYAGFADAVRGCDVEILPTSGWRVPDGQAVGRQLVQRPPAERPTAVFCANDHLAVGVLQELLAGGLNVPQDVAIVGYDDIAWAEIAAVPLTSVRQPREELGRTATRLVMAEANERRRHRHSHVLLEPTLVVRASTMSERTGE